MQCVVVWSYPCLPSPRMLCATSTFLLMPATPLLCSLNPHTGLIIWQPIAQVSPWTVLSAAVVNALSANNASLFSILVREGPYIFACVSSVYRVKLCISILLAMQAANEGGFILRLGRSRFALSNISKACN